MARPYNPSKISPALLRAIMPNADPYSGTFTIPIQLHVDRISFGGDLVTIHASKEGPASECTSAGSLRCGWACLPVDAGPGLFGPHPVRDTRRYDQGLSLPQRSFVATYQDVQLAGEHLEAFFLAGVVVEGWMG